MARDEAEMAQLDSDSELEVVLATGPLDPAELVEDELVLAIPFAPRHPQCPTHASTRTRRQPAQPNESNPTQESSMAVQQNKKSPRKRGMHRAHDHLKPRAAGRRAGERRGASRHHISPSGYYRGKKVVKTKADE